MKNRKKATEYWLNLLNELQKGNKNINMYERYFSSLTDKEFDILMQKCEAGMVLPYYSPNMDSTDLDQESCLNVGKKLGIDFFQQVISRSPLTGVLHKTAKKFFILEVPVRRQSQHITKKKSVAKTTRYIDNLSGQVVGISKTSKLSLPEIQNLEAQGLTDGITELASVRGGNIKGLQIAKRDLINTGSFSLEEVKKTGTRAEALTTANTILRGMLFKSNL